MSFDALKKFVRCNVDDTEIEATVIVEKALEWLEANETVKVYVTDGTYSKHDIVKGIEKKEDETAITTVSGDVFYVKKNDSNVREIKLEYFSRDYYHIWREKLTNTQAKRICADGEDVDVRAIGYSNGKPITTSRIKRFITDDSFETETGSIYKVKQETVTSERSQMSPLRRWTLLRADKFEIGDYNTLRIFANVEDGKVVGTTVNAEEAIKWLEDLDKKVFVRVKAPRKVLEMAQGMTKVTGSQEKSGYVSRIVKNPDEIVVTLTTGETFHLTRTEAIIV